ncbi:MAG: family 20 glycosylhydrolase [Oscillospiraceae bacterium]|nr:family 20 glycosylhydrolase [Oscillospiraceae bacterium]
MLQLIPEVKKLALLGGPLNKNTVNPEKTEDIRLDKALALLPCAADGVPVTVVITGGEGEGYNLRVEAEKITLTAQTAAGAFWGIQTLRQLFCEESVPCVYIEDAPDFAHRGFYHDVTRGRIPTMETLKKLVDDMAYYKLNSLQLYVEHVFPFKETEKLIETTGYMTPEEMKELESYCEENFIDFIPSLSTFGHMFELLNLPEYKHLAVLDTYEAAPNFWADRMAHHTINPLKEESLAVVRSLIGQYLPLFKHNFFNICCDETFDLDRYLECEDPGKVYADFVKKIIGIVRDSGKDVMMWADILLKHPEVIEDIPEETVFLNWFYRVPVPEENISKLAKLGRKQIVCPGTTTWNRFCEDVDVEEENICKMAEYGYKYGAVGVLNTNWGDWGNPCSMELGMYGMVLGAAKSWSVNTQVDDDFYGAVNSLLYNGEDGIGCLKKLCKMHKSIVWRDFVRNYYLKKEGKAPEFSTTTVQAIQKIQKDYLALKAQLTETWELDNYRKEILSAAEAICVVAELTAKLDGMQVERVTDTEKFLATYEENWLATNKESELYKLTNFFRACEAM